MGAGLLSESRDHFPDDPVRRVVPAGCRLPGLPVASRRAAPAPRGSGAGRALRPLPPPVPTRRHARRGLVVSRLSGIRVSPCAKSFVFPWRRLGRLALGFGLGCAVLIPLLFGLGLLRLYYAPVFALLLALPCLIFRRDVLAGILAMRQILIAKVSPSHPLAGIAFIFAVLAAASALAVALSPSIAFDPLAMHLASARYYSARNTRLRRFRPCRRAITLKDVKC